MTRALDKHSNHNTPSNHGDCDCSLNGNGDGSAINVNPNDAGTNLGNTIGNSSGSAATKSTNYSSNTNGNSNGGASVGADHGIPHSAIAQPGPVMIEPLFGDAFVRIFGRQESATITRSLVNAVFRHAGIQPIDEVLAIDAEHTSVEGGVDCRSTRMDVRIVAAGKRYVDLEAQLYPEDVNNRSLLYASQLMVQNTAKGTKFKDIPQVVIITLLDDAPLFPDAQEFVNVCSFGWNAVFPPHEKSGEPSPSDNRSATRNFDEPRTSPINAPATAPTRSTTSSLMALHPAIPGTDRMMFVLIELEKVRKRYNQLNSEVLSDELLSWLYLLTVGFDNTEETEAIMYMYPDLAEFAEMYGYAMNDPKLIRAYEDHASAYREYHSRKDYFERVERESRERGLTEGLAEGRAEGRAEGLAEGRAEGLAEGRAEGRTEGLAEGRAEGLAEGHAEGLAEGRAEGQKEGSLLALAKLVNEGIIAEDLAASQLNITVEQFRLKLADITNKA